MTRLFLLGWFLLSAVNALAQSGTPRAFPTLDQDGDKSLTLEEYLGADAASPREKLRRQQFAVFDFNDDQRLTLDEFAAVPRNTAPQDRTDLPAFYTDLFDQQVASVLEVVDTEVTRAAWEPVASLLPWYLPREFHAWDINHDDVVSAQEMNQQLRRAFGLARADGSPLRRGTGHVFYGYRFHQFLDRDSSGGLAAKELSLERNYDLNAAEELIRQGDSNQDGELEPTEIDALDLYWLDVANEFLQRDKDLNGVLSAEEIAAFPNWDQQVGQFLRAFDRDESRSWDLSEYCQSPAGNRLLDWAATLRDTSDDGVLDFQEFWSAVKLRTHKDSTDCMGLAGLVFDQLDTDQNHKLHLDEFSFEVSVDNLPAKHAFAVLDEDKSGELSIKEITGHDVFIYPFHTDEFAFSDRDSNGSLSHQEFLAGVNWLAVRKTENYVRQRLQPQFEQLDEDQDGLLSLDEWTTKNSGQSKIQDFVMQDIDSDKQLTFIEYCGIRGIAPFGHRGPVSDPVLRDLNDALQKVQQTTNVKTILQLVNQNSSGIKPSDLLEVGTELRYDRQEIVDSLTALFGIRSKTGALLRRPTGEVLNLRMFHNLDLDHDDKLSRDEVVTQHWQGPEKGAELFAGHDLNQDGFLSLEELAVGRYCWIDTTSMFRSFDDDLDGRLSEQEIQTHLSGVDGADRKFLMTAFDVDQDRLLSFVEFRRTPPANPLPRSAIPEDNNNDGVLNLDEFRSVFEDRYHGLTGLFFRCFDLDEDGTLNLGEYDFKFHFHEIPPEKAFVMLDANRDGFTELAEIGSYASKMPARTPAEKHARMMAVEEVYDPLDLDQDSRLSLQEFVDSGHIIPMRLAGREAPLPMKNHLADVNPKQKPQDWRPYVLVGLNLAIIAVIFFYVRRSNVNSVDDSDV